MLRLLEFVEVMADAVKPLLFPVRLAGLSLRDCLVK